MSSGISHTASGALVVRDLTAAGGIHAWVHPGTGGWTSSANLLTATENRRYLAAISDSNDADSGIQMAYAAADSSASVGWGRPRLSGAASLLVVMRSSSL